MPDVPCRNCERVADTGGYCKACAVDITARALNPFHGGWRKKSPRPELPRVSVPLAQQRLFR